MGHWSELYTEDVLAAAAKLRNQSVDDLKQSPDGQAQVDGLLKSPMYQDKQQAAGKGDWKGFSEEDILWVADYIRVTPDELKVDEAEKLIEELLAERKKSAEKYGPVSKKGNGTDSSPPPDEMDLASDEFLDRLDQDPSVRDLRGDLSQVIVSKSKSGATASSAIATNRVAYSLQELIELNRQQGALDEESRWQKPSHVRTIDVDQNWGMDYHTELFRQTARKLQAAHERGEIHSDLDPTRVMILSEGDNNWVGLRKLGAGVAIQSSRKNADGSANAPVEVSRYMAPEQVDGKVDPKTAQFRLGAVMYEVFTGKPFIEGDDPDTIKERVTRSRPRLAHEVNPGVPAEISYILDKATQPSINRRYKSIEHLLADLKQLQLGRPLVGTTIDQKYVLESVLGRGGQGTVFLAYHKGFSRQEEPVVQEDAQDASNNGSGTKKRHVAVKVVDGTDKESIDTFLRESVTTGQIDQRNIVRATDCGQYNDTNYLVLEVLGKSLRSMLTEQGMPTRTSGLYRGNPDDVWGVDYLIKLFEVLADALHYMHERDVTHRDIKPENIMFRNYGTGGAVPLGELHDRVVFTDLGLAMFGGKKEGDQTVSGTPTYFAPEQAEKTRLMRETQMLEILIQRDTTELQALPQKLIDLEKGLQEADEQWRESYEDDIKEAKAKLVSLPKSIDLWRSKIPDNQRALDELHLDTKKIDLYQLGVVMHEAFTTRRYIDVQGGDYTDIEEAILGSVDSPPSQADAVNPSAPVEISGIIRRLTTRADRRYGSAKEVADDLRRYQKDHSLSFETNPLRRMRKWGRRNARAIKTGSAASITFIALGTYGVINERKAARIEAERIQRRQLAEQAYDGVLSDYTSMMGSLPDDLGELEARLSDMESLGARVESTRDNNREGLDKDQVDQLNKMVRQLTSRRSDVERGVTRSRMLSRYRALTSQCATLLTQDVSLREEDLGSYVSMIAQIRSRWEALSQDRDASTLNDAERQAVLQGFTQLDGRVRQLRLSQYEGALAQLRVRIEDATLPSAAYETLSEDLLSLERRIKGVMVEGQPGPQALTLVSQLNERLTHNQEAARTRETQARETLRLHGVSDERYRQAQVACATLADIPRIGSLTELEGHMVVTAEVPRDTQEVARLRVYTQNLEQARIVLEGARDSARAHEQLVQSPEAEARVREIEETYARVLARRDFVNFIVTNRELADRRLSEANVAQANGDYKGALRLVIQSMGLDSQDMGPDLNATQHREHPLQNRFDELNELDRAGEQAIGIEGLTMVSETFAPLYQLHFSFRVAEFAGSEREYGAERDRLIAAVRERVNHLDIPDTTKQTLASILLTINEQAYNQANARAQNDDGDALRNANVLRNTVRYMQEAIGEEYRQGRLGDRQRYGLMVEDMRRALIRREVPADPQQAARLDLWREQGRVLYGAVSSGQRAREETDRECIEPLLRAYSSP